MKAKLTKAYIDKLTPAALGKQYDVFDEVLPGFGIRVGFNAKTFMVLKRIPGGSIKRVTLGKYGHLTLDQARNLAQQELAKISQGIDVNAERKKAKQEVQQAKLSDAQTLRWLLEEYKREQIVGHKGGKEGTVRSMDDTFNYFKQRKLTLLKKRGEEWIADQEVELSNWLDRPFREITSSEVLQRFDMFAVAKPTRLIGGKLQPIQRTHQVAFKFFNSAYNFIIPRLQQDTGEVVSNPADVLKIYKRWKQANKRTRFVDFEKAEFATWWNALHTYRDINPVASDFILFSLLQAARSIDVADLEWSQVDMEKEVVTYPDTKNGADYVYPLSKLAVEILKRCEARKFNNYVFGYKDSETGHVPKDCSYHFHELEQFGAKYISSHDLRRTWASAANHLDISERTINYCLKHRINDVNEHYFMRNQGKLLRAFQGVEDYFVGQVKKFTKSELTDDEQRNEMDIAA
jgi:integrase